MFRNSGFTTIPDYWSLQEQPLAWVDAMLDLNKAESYQVLADKQSKALSHA